VATKIPPKNGQWPAKSGVPVEETFPAEHVIACTEESLRNLRSETIDVRQFHVWSDEWVNRGDWLEAVQKLKEQGKVKFFGVSINEFQPGNAIKLIETGVVDTVQVIYNIFEQSPEDQLLPACERHHPKRADTQSSQSRLDPKNSMPNRRHATASASYH
jgi:aryl-alcohol dehydrogenase-like predicted oxidoreductase